MTTADCGELPALVAPIWADPLAQALSLSRLDSFTDALATTPRRRLVVVDQASRGPAVVNRREAVGALAARHGRVLVVSYNPRMPHYLSPFPEDGPVPNNVDFVGPDVTVGDIAAWLDLPAPGFGSNGLALGSAYLRKGVPSDRLEPLVGFKRVYVALDPAGGLAVAGAFGLEYGPVENTAACGHVPPHPRPGPGCTDGFAAYRYREDALLFRAPDAALAVVDLAGSVIAADSAVTRPGMRAERQRVRRLEFPRICGCGADAVLVRVEEPDAKGFQELRSACARCARGHATRDLEQVGGAGLEVGWLHR